MPQPEPILIPVDEDLMELVPRYLESRKQEIRSLNEALKIGDFKRIESAGHKLKGNAASYGMEDLGYIGADLESAAAALQANAIPPILVEMTLYLNSVILVPAGPIEA